MKFASPLFRLTAAAVAALALASAPARAGSAPGTADVNVIKPLTLVRIADLNFGTVLTGASGTGTVVIDPNTGAATYAGGTAALSGATSAASFTGRASRLSLIYITLPATATTMTRVGGTETITASGWTIDSGGVLRLIGSAPFTFGVGATLNVPAATVGGTYAGQFAVTINYY